MNQEFERIESAIAASKESADAALQFHADLKQLYQLIEDNDNWNEDPAVLSVLNNPKFSSNYRRFFRRDQAGKLWVSCYFQPFVDLEA